MIEVIMPQVGQDIPTAKIIEWCKGENDAVESDKASFEVEAEQGGVLLKVLYGEGDEVEVFKPIAYIGEAGELVDEVIADDGVKGDALPADCSDMLLSSDTTSSSARRSDKVFASPSARRIARECGVDLDTVVGSGPNGRVIHRDVIAASADQSAGVPPEVAAPISSAPAIVKAMEADQVVPFTRMRKRIADRLTVSKQTIPHFYLFVDVDMTAPMTWREFYKQKHNVKVTVTDLIIIAAARALAEHRSINAHVDSDKLVIKRDINIGIATSVKDGLLVPVLANADRLGLQQISEKSREITQDARRGMVDPNNVGSFTISTLGMFGIDRFLPIINPPEAAILGVGAIKKRVVPIAGDIETRDIMTVTLAVDHRGVDGVVGARFLDRLKHNLENIDQVVS